MDGPWDRVSLWEGGWALGWRAVGWGEFVGSGWFFGWNEFVVGWVGIGSEFVGGWLGLGTE